MSTNKVSSLPFMPHTSLSHLHAFAIEGEGESGSYLLPNTGDDLCESDGEGEDQTAPFIPFAALQA